MQPFGPLRDMPHHTSLPWSRVQRVPPPRVPDPAYCGGEVPGSPLRCRYCDGANAESPGGSFVVMGLSSAPTHTQQPSAGSARIHNPGCPSSPQPQFPLCDHRIASNTHSPSRLHQSSLPWIVHCYESTSLRLLIVNLSPFGSSSQLQTLSPSRHNTRPDQHQGTRPPPTTTHYNTTTHPLEHSHQYTCQWYQLAQLAV